MNEYIPGYKVDDNGINAIRYDKEGEELLIPISNSKIDIVSRIKNIETNEVLLRLEFSDKVNGSCSLSLKQGDAFQRRGVMEMANMGALFEESTAKNITQYIKTYLAEKGETIPLTHAYPQMGWNNNVFIYGNTEISYNETKPIFKEIEIIGGDENVKESLHVSRMHLAKEWIDTTSKIREYSRARFMCYVSSAAPLLKILGARSFVVHQYGETSCGKSTLNSLALSIWGDPNKLFNSGNMTVNYAEEFSQFCKDIPVCFDETQLTREEDIVKIIYMLANETGKGRAKREGGTRKTRRWKTVGLTSGEASVTNHKSFAGADIRVVQLYNGLNANDENAIKTYEMNIFNNWGSIGPLIIEDILSDVDGWKKIYNELKLKFSSVSKNIEISKEMKNIGGRLADTFAVICTGGYLFEYLLKEIDNTYETKEPWDICKQTFIEMVRDLSDKGYGKKAWESFISWVHTKKKYFSVDDMDSSEKTYDYYGDIKDESVCILPGIFKEEFCKRHDYDADRVLKDWSVYGWINTDKGRYTKKIRLNSAKNPTRVIVVNYSMNEEVIK